MEASAKSYTIDKEGINGRILIKRSMVESLFFSDRGGSDHGTHRLSQRNPKNPLDGSIVEARAGSTASGLIQVLGGADALGRWGTFI